MNRNKLRPITKFKDDAFSLLCVRYAHIKEKRIKEVINNYVEVVTEEVWRNWLTLSILGDLAHVRKNIIRRYGGRLCLVKGNKTQTYIDNWFNENLQLYKIADKGQSIIGGVSKVTQIQLNYELKINGRSFDELVDLINSVDTELNLTDTERELLLSALYGNSYDEFTQYESDKAIADTVKIDMRSLKAYIKQKQIEEKNNKTKSEEDYIEGLNEKIKEAVRIYRVAELCGFKLIQIINESEFGRKYYKGVNLQSVHKEVRLAALGKCFEYDFENSVYAWRLSKVQEIDKSAQWKATQEYLDKKREKREGLAETVFGKASGIKKEDNIKKIKQIFTAISFGAKGGVKDIYYTSSEGKLERQAINNILKDEKQRKLFFENEFIKRFISEQKEISKIILNAEKVNLNTIDAVKTSKGNISNNKGLAYCYQKNEREIMDACIKNIRNNDLLLLVHDAFYVSDRDLSKTAYEKILRTLRKFNKKLKIERTAHNM